MITIAGGIILAWLLIKQPVFVFRMGMFALVLFALAIGVSVALDSKPEAVPVVDDWGWEDS